jgi:hypothetical protein
MKMDKDIKEYKDIYKCINKIKSFIEFKEFSNKQFIFKINNHLKKFIYFN